MLRYVLLLFNFILYKIIFCQVQDPIVITDVGLIRGLVMKDRNDEDYFAFRGIPYAEAPIGNLRWKVSFNF